MRKINVLFLLLTMISLTLLNSKTVLYSNGETADPKLMQQTLKIPEKFSHLSAEKFNKIALKYHRKKNYVNSLKFFKYSVSKDNNFVQGYFNISCVNSLLNNLNASIDALKISMELDRNWTMRHIKDSDLNNIRNHPDFIVLLSKSNNNSKHPLIGQKLCKSRLMPYDTGYEIQFLENGRITGSINASDNCNIFKLLGGTWIKKGSTIIINLNLIREKVCTSPGKPIGTKKFENKIFKFNSMGELRKEFPDQC